MKIIIGERQIKTNGLSQKKKFFKSGNEPRSAATAGTESNDLFPRAARCFLIQHTKTGGIYQIPQNIPKLRQLIQNDHKIYFMP
jgi:hypothetical protein